MKTTDKIIIDSNVYENNLCFYTMLKLLVQCHLNEKQLVFLQMTILDNKSKINEDISCIKLLILESNAIAKSDTVKYNALSYFISTINTTSVEMWCDFLDLCVDLLLVKDLILQESKVYVATEYKKELQNITDLLSVEYDMSGLHLPYGQRVISSLLLFAFVDTNRKSDYMLKNSEQTIKNFSYRVKSLSINYMLNVNNMFQIVVDESMNQSIKSDAGSSYESRVTRALSPIVENLSTHSHDSKIPSVEYDNTFYFNNKYCGVSAKRTLRERYKQNLENVESLDVDYLFVITLGIDLNEEKVSNILQKHGVYIIVSKEEYNSKPYLIQNARVISSSNLLESFNKVIK